jgi:UDP-2,3-diacylglucosamine pyrophosphatase LpxH
MPRRQTTHRHPTILIISDLHMTSGKDPGRGIWSPTEDFFWDEEFKDFLDHYSGRRQCTLIINGDLFDFLQVLARPSPEEAELYGIPRADVSSVYGLKSSEPATVFQIDKIIDGHPAAFRALSRFLARGHRVVLLRGNHDVQLFWEEAQERLRQRLEEFSPRSAAARIRKNLEIVPWVYLLPGLLYVEHGNQYEAATSFQNFLHPILPFNSPGTGRHIELDLGSIIIRYFANRMEIVNLLSDNIRPLSAYVQTFFRNHPLLFASTARTAISYVVNALSKARRLEKGGTAKEYRRIGRTNDALIAQEAQRIARTSDEADRLEEKLKKRDAQKSPPALGRGPLRLFWDYARTPAQVLVTLLPLAGVPFVPWWWAAACITASLLLGRWFARRRTARRAAENVVGRLRREAENIAQEFNVRFVVFGHSHVEDRREVAQGRWYFNTGTWITVFSERENLYRNPRQFTFLKIEGGEGELLSWDPASHQPREAVVVDPEAAHAPVREDMRSLVRKALRLRWLRMSMERNDRALGEFLERWKKKSKL